MSDSINGDCFASSSPLFTKGWASLAITRLTFFTSEESSLDRLGTGSLTSEVSMLERY